MTRSPSATVKTQAAQTDLTGRSQLVANVIFSWAGHFVYIVAGFILPRMIDQRLGQELLGVWDFSWSLVNYFGLVSAGIASSVNRYVARHRMAGDISGVNAVVSSACCIMAVSGLLALGLTVAAALLLPQMFGGRLGENVGQARWVVLCLGGSLAVEIAFQPYNGVLTGCHRWGLRNLIESGWHAATVFVQIAALVLGGSLVSLSLVYFVGIAMAYLTRMAAAYRVCEGLRVHPSLARWTTIKEQFAFGGKTLIPSVSQLLLNQTTSVLIMAYLGPAALALYSRPRSLILQANTLVKKMALVLIPTVSSLQSEGDMAAVRDVLMKAVRYSCYMVLPIVLVLAVFGGAIMGLWMGPRYADGWLPAVLAVGFLVTMVQTPVWTILAGLNAHGRAGFAEFVTSLCSAVSSVVCLCVLHRGLLAVAMAISIPLTVMNLVYLPLLLRKRVGLHIREYFTFVGLRPAIHVLPFSACLIASRLAFDARPLVGLLVGGTTGAAVLGIVYWRCVLPDRVKGWAVGCLRKTLRLVGLGPATDAT